MLGGVDVGAAGVEVAAAGDVATGVEAAGDVEGAAMPGVEGAVETPGVATEPGTELEAAGDDADAPGEEEAGTPGVDEAPTPAGVVAVAAIGDVKDSDDGSEEVRDAEAEARKVSPRSAVKGDEGWEKRATDQRAARGKRSTCEGDQGLLGLGHEPVLLDEGLRFAQDG